MNTYGNAICPACGGKLRIPIIDWELDVKGDGAEAWLAVKDLDNTTCDNCFLNDVDLSEVLLTNFYEEV